MGYPWEKNLGKPSRYLESSKTYELEAIMTAVPPGHCNWCGKPTPRKNQRFCPGVVTSEYHYKDGGGKIHTVKYREYDCYNKLWAYWGRIPRFKRVVFVRDNFTCQACGVRPTWTNKYGITLPDPNQLACDHIIPYSKGGKTELSNLQTLCRICNSAKKDKMNWQPSKQLVLIESKGVENELEKGRIAIPGEATEGLS